MTVPNLPKELMQPQLIVERLQKEIASAEPDLLAFGDPFRTREAGDDFPFPIHELVGE